MPNLMRTYVLHRSSSGCPTYAFKHLKWKAFYRSYLLGRSLGSSFFFLVGELSLIVIASIKISVR